MARHTRKEFAALCKVTPGYLTQYIKRNKIILDSNGLIADTVEMNRAFLEKRKDNSPPSPSQVRKSNRKREDSKESLRDEQLEAEQAKIDAYNLDRKIKARELEAKEQTIELNRLKIQKLNGEIIPTELVTLVFAQHFKSITDSFYHAADNYIAVVAKRFGGKQEDISFVRGELIKLVNKAVQDSIKESKKNVDNIVNEYSQRRAAGERG